MAEVPNVILSDETAKGAVTDTEMGAVLLKATTSTDITGDVPKRTVPKFKALGIATIVGSEIMVLTVISSKAIMNWSVQLK